MNLPFPGRNYTLTLRERKHLVQGLTDSLTIAGSKRFHTVAECREHAAQVSELRKLRDKLATPAQKKEFT